jgi:N-acetylneuraminic acid mutarotase
MAPLSYRLTTGLLSILIVAFVAASSGGQAPPQPADPATARWTLLPPGDAPLPRHEHAYVKADERFFLIGGRGSAPIKPVEIFDPSTSAWSRGATPPLELHHFQAVEHGGLIYVVGAMTGGYPAEPPVPHVYIYDPANDRWRRGPEMPEGRRRGGAGAVLHDGLIYVVAGITNGHTDGHVSWLDVFDPSTGAWRPLADAPRPRDHFHAAVIDGRLYAAGGRRSSAGTGQTFELTVAEVDVYDFAANRWSTLPATSNLPTPRAGCTVAVVDGRLLVMGGESAVQRDAHAEVEALDPATGRWTTLAPLAVGRHATQAVVHAGRIYLAAGSRTRGATEITSQEVLAIGAK